MTARNTISLRMRPSTSEVLLKNRENRPPAPRIVPPRAEEEPWARPRRLASFLFKRGQDLSCGMGSIFAFTFPMVFKPHFFARALFPFFSYLLPFFFVRSSILCCFLSPDGASEITPYSPCRSSPFFPATRSCPFVAATRY